MRSEKWGKPEGRSPVFLVGSRLGDIVKVPLDVSGTEAVKPDVICAWHLARGGVDWDA